jgi:hypothetical protein
VSSVAVEYVSNVIEHRSGVIIRNENTQKHLHSLQSAQHQVVWWQHVGRHGTC